MVLVILSGYAGPESGFGWLISTKTRVDLSPLIGTGIHPPPPGTPATAARVGTQGAPILRLFAAVSTLNCLLL
jgi:hypothetical protein